MSTLTCMDSRTCEFPLMYDTAYIAALLNPRQGALMVVWGSAEGFPMGWPTGP